MALTREFLKAYMTLVHDEFLIVLAPEIKKIFDFNTCVELKIIILVTL